MWTTIDFTEFSEQICGLWPGEVARVELDLWRMQFDRHPVGVVVHALHELKATGGRFRPTMPAVRAHVADLEPKRPALEGDPSYEGITWHEYKRRRKAGLTPNAPPIPAWLDKIMSRPAPPERPQPASRGPSELRAVGADR